MQGWEVADLHSRMRDYLAAMRLKNTAFTLTADGVHPSATGHWLMAQTVLEAWGMPVEADGAGIEVGMARVNRGHVTELQAADGCVSFKWLSHRPMPMDPQWVEADQIAQDFNRIKLTVSGLSGKQYELLEGETIIAIDGENLARGVDILGLKNLSVNHDSSDLLEKVGSRHRLMCDAWLTAIGHARPWMTVGKPLDAAMRESKEMEREIISLVQPVEMKLMIRSRMES